MVINRLVFSPKSTVLSVLTSISLAKAIDEHSATAPANNALDFFRVLPSQFGAHTPAITDFTPFYLIYFVHKLSAK